MAWKHRTAAPWRDVPERLGMWNSIHKGFNRWAEDGSCIARVHQHAATLARGTGAPLNHKNPRFEPPDHEIALLVKDLGLPVSR
ncbi:hypothetical protein GCM10009820_15090 [Leifsonia soli]